MPNSSHKTCSGTHAWIQGAPLHSHKSYHQHYCNIWSELCRLKSKYLEHTTCINSLNLLVSSSKWSQKTTAYLRYLFFLNVSNVKNYNVTQYKMSSKTGRQFARLNAINKHETSNLNTLFHWYNQSEVSWLLTQEQDADSM